MEKNNHLDPTHGTRYESINNKEMDDEINLIDLIYPIYKKRKFLIRFCLGIAIAVGIVSFFLPKTYEATAIILPATDESGASLSQGLASTFLEQFGMSGLIGNSSTDSSAMFEAVLKGNELAEEVLRRYDYLSIMGINKYGEKKTIKSFAGTVQVTKSKDDPSMSIAIQSHDPVFAANLVNSYVRELNKYNLNNSFTSTRYFREYIEQRMDEAERELDQAQAELREFQEKNSAISISQQAKATLNVLGEMQSKLITLEVDKAAKEKFYKGSHIQIEQLDAQMEALRKNIDQLTYSQEGSVAIEKEGGKIEFYIPLKSMPGLNFDESKMLLKVEAKTGVVTLLTTQLEQAKLDEAKDMPTINVLEWAYPPMTPVKPKLVLNVILSLVVGMFLGIFIVFFMEFIERMDQDPETMPKWMEIKNGIVSFFKFSRRYRW
jgi:tyrosine-protein kinase Etk/Wzc